LSPPLPLPAANLLANWAPAVRHSVALTELMRPLHFYVVNGNQVALRHLEFDPARPAIKFSHRFLSLTRPSRVVFEAQTELVEYWAELREERCTEILSQLRPQFSFWNAVAHLDFDRRPMTTELFSLALSFASCVEMQFKHLLACPRPNDYSVNVQPIIPTPAHGSFPSGHATEAYLIAHLLEQFLKDGTRYRDQLQRLAARTSINRTVAGVHFPIDSTAGRRLGQSLAEYLIARMICSPATPSGPSHLPTPRQYAVPVADKDQDFDPTEDLHPLFLAREQVSTDVRFGRVAISGGEPLLRWFWEKAEAEFM
jgi:hypothetical protein